MSKTLLSESEIKDFMKYANLGKDTTKSFIQRLNEHSLAEAEGDDPDEDAPEDAPEGAPEDMAPEAPDAEGPEGEEAPGAGGEDEAMEAAVEQVVGAIVDALGDLPGAPEISMEAGEEMPGDEDLEAGAEEMPEMPGGEDLEAAAPPEAEEMPEEPELAMERLMEAIEEAELYLEDAMGMDLEEGGWDPSMEEELYEDDEESDYAAFGAGAEGEFAMEGVVNEVTRRVAARILKSRKSSKRR